jgi:murein DD-endopeptidase MepM/ murein hydrolase activator NlpD
MSKGPILLVLALLASNLFGIEKLVWPTPNTGWIQNQPISDFVQDTGSGDPASGLFGCARTDGWQFHEGLDLKALTRDRRGEATDPIFAVESGKVLYVARKPGYSNYGRYIVIEHTEPGLVYQTLYAHLSAIADGIAPGVAVSTGQRIATMGRSAGNGLPKERAHLHLEFNVRLSNDFQTWYNRQKFGSRNYHGAFNGFNFIGWDSLDFFEAYRAGKVSTVADYLRGLPTGVVAEVRTTQIPWFIRQNPALLASPIPDGGVQGWRIEFTQFGLPKLWTPLTTAPQSKLTLTEGPEGLCSCRKMIAGRHTPGKELRAVLELLFGGRF